MQSDGHYGTHSPRMAPDVPDILPQLSLPHRNSRHFSRYLLALEFLELRRFRACHANRLHACPQILWGHSHLPAPPKPK